MTIPVSPNLVFVGKERNTDRSIRVYAAPLALQIDHEPLMALDLDKGDWMVMARQMGGGQCLLLYVFSTLYIAFDIFTHSDGGPDLQESLMRAAMDARARPREW